MVVGFRQSQLPAHPQKSGILQLPTYGAALSTAAEVDQMA